jgi:glycosyltransferase involved in cell wall biosynthesis
VRIALYRNYREEHQPSMRIYADLLARHLPMVGPLVVEAVHPPELLPDAVRQVHVAAKLGDFLGRYVAYPLSARHAPADIHHIIDHGNAHLLWALDSQRTVVTCHDLVPLLTARGRLPRTHVPPGARAIFRALMFSLRRARLIIAVSESTRRDLISELGMEPGQIRVIHSGLQDEHLEARSPEDLLEAEVRLRLGPRPRILSVGVNWPHKNLRGVLEVFARIRRVFPRATLLRVGAPLTAEQRRLCRRLGMTSALHELGRLSVGDLAAVYRLSDLLLFPSYYEGFGWPPLEAMAAGLPVVASPCGSIPEVSGDVPVYAPPDDAEALAEASLRLLRDPALRAQKVAHGLERAHRFTWRKTALATAQAYREILER